MIFPMDQMTVAFGAVGPRRRMLSTMPMQSPTPYQGTGASIVHTGRKRHKGRRDRLHSGMLTDTLGPMTDVSNDSSRKRHGKHRDKIDGGGGLPLPKAGKHKRVDGQGGGGVTGTIGGPCAVTQTLGSCLQCCSHSLRGADRRRCKRECDLRFSGGGGAAGDCYAFECQPNSLIPCACQPGYTYNNAGQCCKGGGPGPQPIPQQSCGVVCVSGTHGNQQDCHYECVDYGTGGTTGIVPTGGGGLQIPPGFAPGGGGDAATVAGPDPGLEPEAGAGFWDTYKIPIIAGGAALGLFLILKKKRGR